MKNITWLPKAVKLLKDSLGQIFRNSKKSKVQAVKFEVCKAKKGYLKVSQGHRGTS
jgi:hypothetical protein